jgi:hypothetical protein
VMAYAAHALNIVSCFAEGAKPEPLSLMVSPNELLEGIEETELERRAEKLQQWQERTSSWPHLAGQVVLALKL